MWRFLADENFNGDVLRGLLLRLPTLDIVTVQAVHLGGAPDPAVLEWAAREDRALLTYDRSTISNHAFDRIFDSRPCPGVFIISGRTSVGAVIAEIVLLVECCEQSEFANRVTYLPI